MGREGKHFWRQLGWESPGQGRLILVLSTEIGFCSDFISLCLGFCTTPARCAPRAVPRFPGAASAGFMGSMEPPKGFWGCCQGQDQPSSTRGKTPNPFHGQESMTAPRHRGAQQGEDPLPWRVQRKSLEQGDNACGRDVPGTPGCPGTPVLVQGSVLALLGCPGTTTTTKTQLKTPQKNPGERR